MERIVRLEVKRPVLRGSKDVVAAVEGRNIERVEGGFLITSSAHGVRVFVPDSNVIEATIELVFVKLEEAKSVAEVKPSFAVGIKATAPKPKKKPRKK